MKLQVLKFTDEFMGILNNMLGEKISKILITLKDKPYFLDFNDIDVVLNTDSIRYTNDKGVKTKTRIGRGINKIFEATGVKKGLYSESDIERFVYLFKAFSNFDETSKNFELVKGDDIKKWYKSENYYSHSGSLGSSCMRDVPSDYFNLYSENPKKIRMLILKDKTGKRILGRAIIWRNIYFRREGEDMDARERVCLMDRIYSSEDSVIDLFKIYATKMGWLYKASQGMGEITVVKDGRKISDPKFGFYLPNYVFKSYPYLDTMVSFSPFNGFISNRKFKDSHYLNNTGGNSHMADIIKRGPKKEKEKS